MSNTSLLNGPYGASESAEVTWKGAPVLRRVHALNERVLEVLVQLARTDRERIELAIINQHRSLWRGLSTMARRRASLAPFLLVDVRFDDAGWWRSVKDPRVARREVIHPTALTGKMTGELMREALMLAWSTVAFDRNAASILLGMTPAVAAIIAEFGPHDVERIAARYCRHLRPRWEDFPAFWGKLLLAAQDGDEAALRLIHLHGAQLIGSELVALLDGKPL